MLFSEHFRIERRKDDDWFDLILDADTELFVDPFLIFQEDAVFWSDAHERLINHFDLCFNLIAQGGRNPASIAYKKAIDLLSFTEPRELCLGYTQSGTSGAGSGRGFAQTMASLMADAIERGISNIQHFETLGVFEKGIGADRISDITCTILKPKLITYTQNVAGRHDLPIAQHTVQSGAYDTRRQRWRNASVELPTNPTNGRPILLVPKRFLRDLPTLNADDWWAAYEHEQLRTDMNYEVMGNVSKEVIVATARSNPEFVHEWAREKESLVVLPYNFATDSCGVYQWDPASREFVNRNPLSLSPPQTPVEFFEIIELVIDRFRLYVEEQGGWELLWNPSREKPEKAAQLLFRGIARSYCEANNIVLDAEVDLGRGPVDFKFSNGYGRRAHLEVKKLHNGRFWHGLEEQLPSYLRSDAARDGWFLAVRYRDGKSQNERVLELPSRVASAAAKYNRKLQYALIDARQKPSASRVQS